jgi:hypothetical protein
MPSRIKALVKETTALTKAAGADALVFLAVCVVVSLFVYAKYPVLGFVFGLLAIPAYVAMCMLRMRHRVREYQMQIDLDVQRKLQERTQRRSRPKRGGSLH